LEKRESGHIQGLPKFFGYPLLSQERVKIRTSNFVHTFTVSIGTKAHNNFWEKVAMGVVRESRKFSGNPIWGALRGHLCDSTAFLFLEPEARNGACLPIFGLKIFFILILNCAHEIGRIFYISFVSSHDSILV